MTADHEDHLLTTNEMDAVQCAMRWELSRASKAGDTDYVAVLEAAYTKLQLASQLIARRC